MFFEVSFWKDTMKERVNYEIGEWREINLAKKTVNRAFH